jgi:cofilin
MDSKNSTIIIDKIAEKDEGYESFAAYISGTDCRYAVVDVPVVTDDGRETSKLVFISWIPDTAKVRSKMLYAGSKEYLKCAMPGIAIAVNCTDHADLDYESNIKPVCLKYA